MRAEGTIYIMHTHTTRVRTHAAGVLIIWDRMFGTFQPELREEKVVYGLVHPLATWDPFWAQVYCT